MDVYEACQCHCLLVRDDVNFWPLRELVHGYQNISVFPVALREKPSDVKCDPLEVYSDVVLVHQTLNSGSGPRLAAHVSLC